MSESLFGITEVDRYSLFLVRIGWSNFKDGTKEVKYQKSFAYRKCGSKDLAFKKAVEYRDKVKLELFQLIAKKEFILFQRRHGFFRKDGRITNLYLTSSFDSRRNISYHCWKVTFQYSDGSKTKSKTLNYSSTETRWEKFIEAYNLIAKHLLIEFQEQVPQTKEWMKKSYDIYLKIQNQK